MPYKQSNWTHHLRVDGVDMGYWAAKEGGGVSTEDSTYSDWDGDQQLGGKASREDATLRKLYREGVHAKYRFLDGACIRGAKIVWTATPTGDDGVAWGEPIVRTGRLGAVAEPDADKSSSEGGELSVTLKLDTKLA